MKRLSILFIVFLTIFAFANSKACTNYLITKGASADGSTFVTYAADSHQLYGALYFWAAANWDEGEMLNVYEWDTGKFLGQIPQVAHTYNVIGNMNENQVTIGETTYGGLDQLGSQEGAIIDYGSLIYITLQRAKTAREAIKIMGELVENYGYYSSGESFSVADAKEVWIMEMIGKGKNEKGAVWVARLVPDGYICGHANQARITTFPFQEKNNFTSTTQTVYHTADVISFAKDNKLFKGKDEDFSFSDVYAPVNFGGARFCEIRVYSFFKDFNSDIKNNNEYWEYCKGNIKHDKNFLDGTNNKNKFASNRMPLWVKVDKKVTVEDVMDAMRDHLEGTELDMSKDIGAGPYEMPYRWRGLTWKVDGEKYCNERVTATQQTGFSFVAQMRSWLPAAIGGIFWLGIDDASSCVYSPMYCGITSIPETYREGNGSMIQWSDNSAFWIFNQVTNLAYTRYNLIHPEVEALQSAYETKFINYTPAIDMAAKTLYEQDKELGIQFITDYSCNTANSLVRDWQKFYQYLFMKYVDGNMKVTEGRKFIDNGEGKNIPKVEYPGYGEDWYKKIIEETGEKFKMPDSDGH